MTKGRTRTDNISVEELGRILAYDPETGICTWKVPRGTKMKPGQTAGCKNVLGYYFVGIDRRRYYVHRIAFALMTGEWPSGLVDHIDMDRGNNRWSNLRHATKSENMQNRGKQKNNTTGVKCVWVTEDGRFAVTLNAGGKKHYVGRFATLTEAATAAEGAIARIHGEFARLEA